MTSSLKAVLVLEDGSIIHGFGFGAGKTVKGELVFNTGMTGYEAALTDPSYNGQILMMTYPLIGNYGVMPETNWESDKIQAEGFVVREICQKPSHRFSEKTIDAFLKAQDIPGIHGIDTRALTIKTRQSGTLRAILKTYEGDLPDSEKEILCYEARVMPAPERYNLVAEVSSKEPIRIPPDMNVGMFPKKSGLPLVALRSRIALIDCGVKRNIIRELNLRGCEVVLLPYDIPPEEIDKLKPDGILVSNGPGDPAHPEIIAHTVKTIRAVCEKYPIMGICLGHQILSLVFGARTYKLKFGHRGANQPVKSLLDNRVYITSQNHGFAVDPASCPKELEIIGINVSDGTVEAMEHKKLPIFSVQYHPEASPGPHDSKYLFDRFVKLCLKEKT
jgi:carbamoyl-phosphate synthase small subunit